MQELHREAIPARAPWSRVIKRGETLIGFREKASHFVTDISRCETLLPAVGASMKVLPGLSVRNLCIIPLSVATMNSRASSSRAALRMPEVEPTASARATTSAGDSGCTSTRASGCAAISSAIAPSSSISIMGAATSAPRRSRRDKRWAKRCGEMKNCGPERGDW